MWLALIPFAFIAVCEAYYAGAVFGPSVMVGRSAELVLAACCVGAAFVRPTLSRTATIAALLAAVAMVWQFLVWCIYTEVHEPGSLWMIERLGALVSAVGLASIIMRGSLPGWALAVGFSGAVGAMLTLWQTGLLHWLSLHPIKAEIDHEQPLVDYQQRALDSVVHPWAYSAENAEWPQYLTHVIMLCAQPLAWIGLVVVAVVFFMRQVRPVPPHSRETWLFSRQWWYQGPVIPLQAVVPSTTLAARVEGAAWGLGLAGCGTYALAVGGEMTDWWDAGRRAFGVVMGVWVEPPFGNCNFTSGGAAPLVGLAVALAAVQIARWVRGKGPRRWPVEISILLLVAVGIGVWACYAMGTGMFNGDVVRAVSVDALAMAAFSAVFLLPRRIQLAAALAGCVAVVSAQIMITAYLLPNEPAVAATTAAPVAGATTDSATPSTPTATGGTDTQVAPELGSDHSTGLSGAIMRHLGKAPSTVWRILWWRLAAGACLEEPWHGYGPGATLAVLPDRPGFDKTWLVVPCYGEHAHHEPLEVIMDGGLPLFALLMTCVGFTIAPLWRRRHQGVPAALLITWAGVFGNSLVDCHLSQPGPVMFLGLLAGVSWAAGALPLELEAESAPAGDGTPATEIEPEKSDKCASIMDIFFSSRRISQIQYVYANVVLVLFAIIPGFVLYISNNDHNDDKLGFFIPIIIVIFAFIFIQVKRWHDVGMSGWMALSNLIAGPLIFIMLAILPGKPDSNRFGEKPFGDNRTIIAGLWSCIWSFIAIMAIGLLLRQSVIEFHDGGAPDMIVLRAQSRLKSLFQTGNFAGYRAEKHTLRERLGPLDDLAFQEAWAAWREGKYDDADALAIEESRRLAPHEGNLNLLAILINTHHSHGEDASADIAAYRAAIARVRQLLAQVPEDEKNHSEYEKLRDRLKMPLP